jgi:hypothetical protein
MNETILFYGPPAIFLACAAAMFRLRTVPQRKGSTGRASLIAGTLCLTGAVLVFPDVHHSWEWSNDPEPASSRLVGTPPASGDVYLVTVGIMRDAPAIPARLLHLIGRGPRLVAAASRQDDTFAALAGQENPREIMAAAYRFAGRPVTITGIGVDVYDARGSRDLDVGDVIVSINDRPVRTSNEYLAALYAPHAYPLTMQRRRGNRTETLTLPGSPGVFVRSRPELRFDFGTEPSVGIAPTTSIGSSDGLPMGLAVLVQLGAIPAPARPVVATGTLTADGRVTEIGGADLKAASAQRVHPCVFLVPANNVAAARAAEPALNIVGVASLTDAVNAIRNNRC